MQIAVHVDDSGRPLGLHEPGRLRIYQGTGTGWALSSEFPFRLPREEGVAGLRWALGRLADEIAPCRVLLSAEVRGFAYAYLQDQLGFHVWKSEGPLEGQLAAVAEGEDRIATEACACDSVPEGGCGSCGPGGVPDAALPPVPVEDRADGTRFLDLAAALAGDRRRNSMTVLGPLLAEAPFRPLMVRMDHLPRWFRRSLAERGLAFTEEPRDGVLFVTVTSRESPAP
ncbi:Fe-only nitrogenase accessory protein AnfO [Rhodovulum sp. YEN HP10]|uniref:Fe-only nitrogenase accessory protein AnfO n=1 Tax=Rhodovulum sp. HP10 TaxID=3387397 RepID=UPI0039E1922E